jgi:hypothetical protein
LLFFQEHFRRVVNRIQPRLCIAWHQFFSFHYALPGLLAELGIPLLYAEFGPLPGTIIFDRGGQMAESEIATRSEEFLRTPVTDAELDAAAKFIARVRAEQRTRKPQPAPGAVREALRARGMGEGTPVIFYAGQYDCRTGMRPRMLPNAKLHSPWFKSTLDSIEYLSALAKKNGWIVLFKPHPLAAISQTQLAQLPAADRLVCVPHASIFECMDVAKVVTTIVSQVSYMALIHRKPCVMLGRNQISGKGCAYEPDSKEAIEESFRTALSHGQTASQESAFCRHVAQLLKTAVFAFDDNFSAPTLRGLDAAASELMKASANLCANGAAGADRQAQTLYAMLRAISPLCAPLRLLSR